MWVTAGVGDPRAAKRKGRRWEREVAAYLAANGYPAAERRALAGARDRGDITGVPGWVLECKSTRALDLAEAITEAEREREHAGARWAAAVVKRRGRGPGEAYAVLPLARLVEIMRALPDPD